MKVKGIPFLACGTCRRPLLAIRVVQATSELVEFIYRTTEERGIDSHNITDDQFKQLWEEGMAKRLDDGKQDPTLRGRSYRWHTKKNKHTNKDVRWMDDCSAVQGWCEGCHSEFYVHFHPEIAEKLKGEDGTHPEANWIVIVDVTGSESSNQVVKYTNCHMVRGDHERVWTGAKSVPKEYIYTYEKLHKERQATPRVHVSRSEEAPQSEPS